MCRPAGELPPAVTRRPTRWCSRRPEYDTLVDPPTLMATFDVTRFTVEGKPHDLVENPAGVFSAEKSRTLIGRLTKLAETQGRIFGGLPYKKFVYFYFFRPAEASAGVTDDLIRVVNRITRSSYETFFSRYASSSA